MAEKLDVIDFIISALREHERSLDDAINKLSELIDTCQRRAQGSEFESHTVQIRPPPQHEHPSKPAGEEIPSEEDEAKHVLRQILQLLDRYGFLSLTDLSRMVSEGTRNWLSGFMAALEALNIVKRRGTATHKIYTLTERGRRHLEEG